MSIFRVYLGVLFALFAMMSDACTRTPSPEHMESLALWVQANRPHTKALLLPPGVVQYRSIVRAERVAQCGSVCDHDDGVHDLNIYFVKGNRIALVADAREDQLVHELVHAHQHAENPEVEGGDDSLEDEAVSYQQRYREEKGSIVLDWMCTTAAN